MSVTPCSLCLGPDRRELRAYGIPGFPCDGYRSPLDGTVAGDIPWHWHRAVEAAVVRKGALRLGLPGDSLRLREGEAFFINSNLPHTLRRAGGGDCVVDTLVFEPDLIAGEVQSVFWRRYVDPLLRCSALSCLALRSGPGWQSEAIGCIAEAHDLFAAEDFGYELLVRERLTRLWLLISANLRPILGEPPRGEGPDALRLKAMLDLIHRQFSHPLDLGRIARAASVSERECLRCFRGAIGLSPMQYLMKHRVAAAARLLAETGRPISEVCGQSGFDSPSYFAKCFRRLMGMTPTAYRRRSRPGAGSRTGA